MTTTLTNKKNGVRPYNEVWEVQPLYDVVIEVGILESPWVIYKEESGEVQNQYTSWINFPLSGLSGALLEQLALRKGNTHLCKGQAGYLYRQNTGRWLCMPGNSSIWARPLQWLFFCVDTRHQSANRHESWHRNPFADRLH